MKKVRFAVVGLGHFAQNAVLPAFKHARGAELTALATGDPKKARVLGKKYKAEHVVGYAQLDALYASGAIDAVYIVTPNHLHRQHCEQAARYGLHVLTEKPMAPTVEDAEAMRRACEQAGVQ